MKTFRAFSKLCPTAISVRAVLACGASPHCLRSLNNHPARSDESTMIHVVNELHVNKHGCTHIICKTHVHDPDCDERGFHVTWKLKSQRSVYQPTSRRVQAIPECRMIKAYLAMELTSATLGYLSRLVQFSKTLTQGWRSERGGGGWCPRYQSPLSTPCSPYIFSSFVVHLMTPPPHTVYTLESCIYTLINPDMQCSAHSFLACHSSQ